MSSVLRFFTRKIKVWTLLLLLLKLVMYFDFNFLMIDFICSCSILRVGIELMDLLACRTIWNVVCEIKFAFIRLAFRLWHGWVFWYWTDLAALHLIYDRAPLQESYWFLQVSVHFLKEGLLLFYAVFGFFSKFWRYNYLRSYSFSLVDLQLILLVLMSILHLFDIVFELQLSLFKDRSERSGVGVLFETADYGITTVSLLAYVWNGSDVFVDFLYGWHPISTKDVHEGWLRLVLRWRCFKHDSLHLSFDVVINLLLGDRGEIIEQGISW